MLDGKNELRSLGANFCLIDSVFFTNPGGSYCDPQKLTRSAPYEESSWVGQTYGPRFFRSINNTLLLLLFYDNSTTKLVVLHNKMLLRARQAINKQVLGHSACCSNFLSIRYFIICYFECTKSETTKRRLQLIYILIYIHAVFKQIVDYY